MITARDKTVLLKRIIDLAITEDLGREGDITSNACVSPAEKNRAELIAKEEGVLFGLNVFSRVFKTIGRSVKIRHFKKDGDKIAKGELVARLYGKSRQLLAAERTAMNFIQRLSGIATYTGRIVDGIESNHLKILDTRKTTPGMRVLEKQAVLAGGGRNHRFCLDDMVLIKENHIVAAGGIEQALRRCMPLKKKNRVKIEIEVRNLTEYRSVLPFCPDIVMLDNMSTSDMRKAVALRPKGIALEASGNMDLKKIKRIQHIGIDYVSIGGLTHSAPSLDFSLLFQSVS